MTSDNKLYRTAEAHERGSDVAISRQLLPHPGIRRTDQWRHVTWLDIKIQDGWSLYTWYI